MSEISPEQRQDRIKEIIGDVQDLPTLPNMVVQINKLMLDPKTTAKQMGKLISSDPSITAKVLRVVNSSFYGFPSRITTVTHAIVILGFNTVKSIVLSISVFDSFSVNQEEDEENIFNLSKFWEHSVSVGACTKVVASHVGFTAPEEFFIAGMLHDIGKILFMKSLPDEFSTALGLVRKHKVPLRVSEKEIFGVTHAELGGYLLEGWKLSKGFANSIRYHHNPALAGDELKMASVIHIGDILARCLCLGNGGDPYVPAIADAAWEALELKEDLFPKLLEDSWAEAHKARVFLSFL